MPRLFTLLAVVVGALPAACGTAPPYVPRTRDVVLTAVPLLTREMQAIYPFLKQDFAPDGVLVPALTRSPASAVCRGHCSTISL